MQCFEQKFYGNKLYNNIKIDLNLFRSVKEFDI